MRFYMFQSETRKDLRAFAGDRSGTKLPERHGPWKVTGEVGVGRAPPHQLSRPTIEKAIGAEGFQLWRLREDKIASETSE